jgi:glycine cleavage system protein P-like pyridoxal-binding family
MRERLDFDASFISASLINETVPTEGQEPRSKVRLDRLRYCATYYAARRKAQRQDKQIKRKHTHDAAARTVAEASVANAKPTLKHRPNTHHITRVSYPKPNARLELGQTGGCIYQMAGDTASFCMH